MKLKSILLLTLFFSSQIKSELDKNDIALIVVGSIAGITIIAILSSLYKSNKITKEDISKIQKSDLPKLRTDFAKAFNENDLNKMDDILKEINTYPNTNYKNVNELFSASVPEVRKYLSEQGLSKTSIDQKIDFMQQKINPKNSILEQINKAFKEPNQLTKDVLNKILGENEGFSPEYIYAQFEKSEKFQNLIKNEDFNTINDAKSFLGIKDLKPLSAENLQHLKSERFGNNDYVKVEGNLYYASGPKAGQSVTNISEISVIEKESFAKNLKIPEYTETFKPITPETLKIKPQETFHSEPVGGLAKESIVYHAPPVEPPMRIPTSSLPHTTTPTIEQPFHEQPVYPTVHETFPAYAVV